MAQRAEEIATSREFLLKAEQSMRIAALDYGKVRIGLAVADELGLMAHPRPHLDGRDPNRALQALSELGRAEQITLFLVGLPRQLDGREGLSARRARQFAQRLQGRTGIPVELVDEWLTSVEASARLRDQGLSSRQQRGRVDSAAAAVLLQSYLDGKRGEP